MNTALLAFALAIPPLTLIAAESAAVDHGDEFIQEMRPVIRRNGILVPTMFVVDAAAIVAFFWAGRAWHRKRVADMARMEQKFDNLEVKLEKFLQISRGESTVTNYDVSKTKEAAVEVQKQLKVVATQLIENREILQSIAVEKGSESGYELKTVNVHADTVNVTPTAVK